MSAYDEATLTTTSTAACCEATLYFHVETRAERLMRHSNMLATVVAKNAEKFGMTDEQVPVFEALFEMADEFAALARLFEEIDRGQPR